MTDQLPGYTWIDNAAGLNAGDYATDGPAMIVLHMTVSTALSASYVKVHPYPPQCWANPYTGDLWQTIDLHKAGKALYQSDFNAWANKHGYCIQTELVGVPVVNQTTYTDAQLRWIAANVVVPQARFLASIGKPVNLHQYRYHVDSSGSANVDWPGRMTDAEQDAFNGVCGHIDISGNDHWDCSVERLDLICQYALEIMGESTPPKGWLDMLTEAQQDELYAWVRDIHGWSLSTYWQTGNTMPAAGVPSLADKVDKVDKKTDTIYWATGNDEPKAGVETVSSDARAARKNTEELLGK